MKRALWSSAILALFTGPADGSSQSVSQLAVECAGQNVELSAWCQELALAAAAAHRATGLAASLGSDIPGSPSTLGRRLGSAPRIGFSLAALGLRAGIPDVARGNGVSGTEQETFSLVGLKFGVAVGAIDGIQLAPTVGGVFSVDALASYAYSRLPSGAGFDGNASGLGLGARVGLFRESFTLPGVSVSAMRHWPGGLTLGSVAEGGSGEVEVDGSVTSLRATVGKNLFALGLLGGVGWDRYNGEARVLASITDPMGAAGLGTATGEITTERRMYFVSGWFNFLVYQLSGELGLADGFADPFGLRAGGFSPSDRTFFASAAFRITL